MSNEFCKHHKPVNFDSWFGRAGDCGAILHEEARQKARALRSENNQCQTGREGDELGRSFCYQAAVGGIEAGAERPGCGCWGYGLLYFAVAGAEEIASGARAYRHLFQVGEISAVAGVEAFGIGGARTYRGIEEEIGDFAGAAF